MKNLFGEETIRTLGLYQPFATLMLHGKVETRFVTYPKKAPFQFGKYLIYSTIKCYDFDEAMDLMGDQEAEARVIFRKEFEMGHAGTIHPDTRNLLLGHAIGIGDLIEIIDPITPDNNVKTFVEYVEPCSRRRVGLVFENMRRIKPFPFKGKQGIGFLTPEQKQLIEFV